MIDGCTFGIVNFTFLGAGESYWYGGKRGETDGILLADEYVPSYAFPTDKHYSFRTTAGSPASFYDFDQFRLFEKYTNTLLATADLPLIQTLSNSATSPSSSSSSSESINSTSSSQRAAFAGAIFGSVLFILIMQRF